MPSGKGNNKASSPKQVAVVKGETRAHIEINVDANLADGSRAAAVKEQSIELLPTDSSQAEDLKGVATIAASAVTSDEEAEPLRGGAHGGGGVGGLKLNGTTNDDGGEATEGDSPSEDLDDYRPSQKRSRFWDVRCVLMGLLVLLIIVGGSIMAIMAHNDPGGEKFVEELVLSSYFSDHMVLQRAPRRAIIWGLLSSRENQTVVLTLTPSAGGLNKTYKKSVSKGAWSIQLDPVSDRQPYNMTLYLDGKEHNPITVSDILFGDVWVCAGTMEILTVRDVEGLETMDKYDQVRYMFIPSHQSNNQFSINRRPHVVSWSIAQEAQIATDVDYWSGKLHTLCWLYGRKLYDSLHYPVGVIIASYPKVSIDDWVSQEVVEACPVISGYRRSAGGVWNAMISPLTHLSVRGFVWHEASYWEPDVFLDKRPMYNCTLVRMVEDWRGKFANGSQCYDCEYPFGIVQLPPVLADTTNPHSAFEVADRRWQQTANYGYVPNQHLPKTFMATSIDLFEPVINESRSFRWYDILANRLVLAARAEAYSHKVLHQGPFPRSYTIDKNSGQMHLTTNVSPLDVRNKTGFEICCSGSPNHYCIASLLAVSYAANREWIRAPIVRHSDSTITLAINCTAYVVGIRYAWNESPCALERCAIYGKQSQLPMPPYIRLGLTDNNQPYDLPLIKHDLL